MTVSIKTKQYSCLKNQVSATQVYNHGSSSARQSDAHGSALQVQIEGQLTNYRRRLEIKKRKKKGSRKKFEDILLPKDKYLGQMKTSDSEIGFLRKQGAGRLFVLWRAPTLYQEQRNQWMDLKSLQTASSADVKPRADPFHSLL